MIETLINLFISFFSIGAVSFGGGYAMLKPMEDAVMRYGWLDKATFADGNAIATMSPGPFAVNMATFVGIRTAGIPGALAASLGVLCPSVIIVTLIARFFYGFQDNKNVQGVLSGIRPVVIGLIASAVLSLSEGPFTLTAATRLGVPGNIASMIIAASMLIALQKFKLHPILSIAISAILGIAIFV